MRSPRPVSHAWAVLLLLAAAPVGRAQLVEVRAVQAPLAQPQPPKAPEPLAAPTGPALHLANGDFVGGALATSDEPGVLRWQGEAFTAPFAFPVESVGAIHWPPPPKPPVPDADYNVELAGGDVLFGALVALDAQALTLDAPRFGRLRIPRDLVQRVHRRREGGHLIYFGPNSLSEMVATPADGWREEAGQPTTDRPGATLRADVRLPERAVVEFEVSWEKHADFVLGLGIDDDGKTIQRAFRFEVWDDDLVVVRESDLEADLAALAKLAKGRGRAHFRAYIDQVAGRILVESPDGQRLADLTVASRKPRPVPGILLSNGTGDLRLERLIVSRWDGQVPPEHGGGASRLVQADNTISHGSITFDPAARQFVVRGESGESRIDEAGVASLILAPPAAGEARDVRVVYQDGMRLSGDLLRVDAETLELKVPGLDAPLRPPLEGLRSLVVLRRGAAPASEKATPRLELDGARLHGRLVDSDAAPSPGASCLAWQPAGSRAASPLRAGAAGRIVLNEPAPPSPPGQPQPTPAAPVGLIRRILPQQATNPAAAQGRPGSKRMLYLRSGDILPAEVTQIDEEGVWFHSPLSASTFVPNAKVQAVVLAAETAVTVRLNKPKRERLLTLPRMQKPSPPTHLIRSKNGDYLRGRVLGLDEKNLRVEVRLEEKPLPRDLITRIIWLHPDDLNPSQPAAEAPPGEPSARVQALRRDGVRLTFVPDRFTGQALHGTSDVLGECNVRVADVDQLLIGAAIEREAAQLAYHRWKLQNAPEPKTAGSDGGGSTGLESALVGKAAPDFELELLDGSKFKLSQSKGKVVILDFWATWCGPCLRAMPQVEAVAREFADRDVRLVAVNLQEEPDPIRAMLQRHNLDVTVALDRDGLVAQLYGANAIPQTVVIDREGKVARLYIGGGSRLGDDLREALRAVLDGAPEAEPAQ
jgi:thiol-disulfide isomerase/thioredoxin